ncbi:MAG: SDR family NAD(P)-dependent oxidoreductase [Bacteroidaceae bacterium]|nr:SDR family NAD(P)-dependent oxidoreductase [Bacteroidaceae bacterium]
MRFNGANVLITGGASGIGRIMGRMALERGSARLIIWDINESNIELVKNELSGIGQVSGLCVDVSDSDIIEKAYRSTVNTYGPVDILIQCAGIVTSNATFDSLTPRDIERTMMINAVAPMNVAHVMLADMIKRDKGHICNIASAAGMLSMPKMSVYSASKWSVIGWSDSVRIELAKMKSKVRFTTVAPYFINTGMFDGVSSKIFPILDPENTARKIIRAIERNKDFRGIPFGFHFIRFWQAVLPVALFDYVFGTIFGIYHTMDHFTGRKNDNRKHIEGANSADSALTASVLQNGDNAERKVS